MASSGEDQGYLQEVSVSWAEDQPSGRGPIGRALRTGRPQFSRNTSQDQDFAPWRNSALQRGFRAVATFPLSMDQHVLGALTLYSPQDTFDHEEIDLLCKLTDNLSFGIKSLRTQSQRDEKELLLRRNTYALQERVKELDLLYTMSKLKSREDLAPADILKHIVAAIPQAWRFPDRAVAKIEISGYGVFTTPGATSVSVTLSHPITLGGEKRGTVEVAYTQPPDGEEDPFLPEERRILESVAHNVEDIVRYVQLASEQRKLSGALAQAADTVVITDRNGTIEYVNPAFEANTGYSRTEAVGHKPNILKSGQHPQEFYKKMWETILNGHVYKDTVINRAKDGSLYYEYKTITPLYDQQGRLTHFLATGKDLTEQLKTERRL